MLQQLEISNVALVEKVSIDFGAGLNILTGETGAGKSIIIDSLQAVLGGRLSKDIIRTGSDRALVEAVFKTGSPELDYRFESLGITPEEDGTVIISREFAVSGKNTCRVNGKLVTVTALRELGEMLVDVHGQHDNQSLLRTDSHIELLDAFGGRKIELQKLEFRKCLDEYRKVRQRLRSLAGDGDDKERRLELLRYQVEEICKADLKLSEDEELNKKRMVLSNSERIITSLAEAYELLYSGGRRGRSALDSINDAVGELSAIGRFDSKYENLSGRLKELSYMLEDLASELRDERDGLEFDPELLARMEERLDVLFKLKKKYGGTLEEVLKYGERARRELEEMESSEELVTELSAELSRLDALLVEKASKLHSERLAAAERLEGLIGSELDDLEMKRAQFKVSVDFNDLQEEEGRKYTPAGLDSVEFLISPNAGEPLKPLSKIASGGEMSRIMLAIKTILAEVDNIPTLIFDEIDSGIGGKASQKVGEKLAFISGGHQVLCVTHVASIACMADYHFLIRKVSSGNRTETLVGKLDNDDVREEIARLLSGSGISETTRKLALEMLECAKKFKTGISPAPGGKPR